MDQNSTYPARLEIDYPETLDRLTTFFRIILFIPIAVILSLLTATGSESVLTSTGDTFSRTSGGIVSGLWLATMLMILFRRRYPRWWFDFALELTRFEVRVCAYLVCLTDKYPSTVEEQSVHLEIDYPDVEENLHRGMPLVKWFLAIPHCVVLGVLFVAAVFMVIVAWLSILFTGKYPKPLFDFVVGVARWSIRVQAYAVLLVTDRYPPFSLH